jgi:hypothetical protein
MLVAPQQQMADFMRCSVPQYFGRGRHATFGECLDPAEENASVGPRFASRRHDGETQRGISKESVSGRKTGEDSQNDLRRTYLLLTGQRSIGSWRLERAVKPRGLDSCFPKDLCGIQFRTLQGRA